MLAALASAAVLAAGPAAAPAWQPGILAAEAYARTRRGQVSFAVRTPCGAWGRRVDRAVPSASVVKAMMLVAYLRRDGVRDRALTAGERALLAPMIRRSDDAAASRVVGLVGADRLARDARIWGMRDFHLRLPIWGDSLITARDQTRLWLRIDRRLPPRHRAYGLQLLRTVVPSQRWGVGRASPSGWTAHFKGGWGSGTGAVDHQAALLTRGDERVALAMLTTAQGTHAYGKATLEGLARRLTRGLAGRARVC